MAVARHRFFGRDTISFLVILPLALPGIVTGMALNATFTQVLSVDLTLFTVIVGHATFCIVVVYNNAVARLRRTRRSLEEAAQRPGRGTVAGVPRRHLPADAHRAGGGRAAGVRAVASTRSSSRRSRPAREETLPIWIFTNYSRPNQLPIVNVVGLTVIVLSIIPVYFANRLSQDRGLGARGREPRVRLVVLVGGQRVDDDLAVLPRRESTTEQNRFHLGLQVVPVDALCLDRPAVPVGDHVNVAHRARRYP